MISLWFKHKEKPRNLGKARNYVVFSLEFHIRNSIFWLRELDLNQRPSGYENQNFFLLRSKSHCFMQKILFFHAIHIMIFVIFIVFHWRKGTNKGMISWFFLFQSKAEIPIPLFDYIPNPQSSCLHKVENMAILRAVPTF